MHLTSHLSIYASYLSPIYLCILPLTYLSMHRTSHLSIYASYLSPIYLCILPLTYLSMYLTSHLSIYASYLSPIYLCILPLTYLSICYQKTKIAQCILTTNLFYGNTSIHEHTCVYAISSLVELSHQAAAHSLHRNDHLFSQIILAIMTAQTFNKTIIIRVCAYVNS